MTTVTGDLTAAGLITFWLSDQDGRRVHEAFVAGNSIVSEIYVDTDALGVYSTSLFGNADIQADATATYWVRGFGLSQQPLLVPTSGTWDELQIAANPPPASPDPIATNLITSASITAAVTGLSVNVFLFADVAGTTVTVPDLTYSVRIEGVAPIVCPATANIDVGCFVTRVSDTSNRGADYHWAGTANLPYTCRPIAVLPPHSADTYKMRVYSFSTVTLNVDAQEGQPAGLWVYGI